MPQRTFDAALVAEIAEAVEKCAQRFGRDRMAVVLGTSTSGMAEGETAYVAARKNGVWPADFHYRQQETGNLGEFVASALRLTGPAYTVATACSSSGKAFASARRLISVGLADAALVGGADTLCRMTVGGFSALEAMSGGLCSPFSRNRDGISIGSGSRLPADPGTRADPICGVGESSDAHHISAPDPDAAVR